MIGGGPDPISIPWGGHGVRPPWVYAKGGRPPRAPTRMVGPSPFRPWRRPDGRRYGHDPECGPGCDGGAKSSILEGAGRYSDFLPVSGLPVFALNIWWALERVLVQWHCLFGLPASFFVVIETYWVLVLA